MEIPKDTDKFVLSSTDNVSDANYVLFGSEDDSGSAGLAHFEGASKGPDAIRKESNIGNAYHRMEDGQLNTYIANSFAAINRGETAFVDIGNIAKEDIADTTYRILDGGKFPIMLGGDHSLTYEVLRGIDKKYDEVAMIVFDAHPDLRSSLLSGRKSYATVMYDVLQLGAVRNDKFVQIGVRDIEPEEFANKEALEIDWITPFDIERIGVEKVLEDIKSKIGDLPLYISVDLDALDRAFAPGVSTPTPGGMSSRELLYILTELADRNVIGLDVVEYTPSVDVGGMTAQLAAKLIIEFFVRHK